MDAKQAKQEVSFLVARLKEPSSWAGMAAILMAAGIKVDPTLWGLTVQAGVALAGIAAFFLSEKSS